MPAPTSAPDPRAATKLDLQIGGALGALTVALLAATEKAVGVPRDESFYFRAGHDYAQWFKELWNHPGNAFNEAFIAHAFGYNTEHPALMKELFGISHELLYNPAGNLRSIAAYRIPSWILAGVFAFVLYLFGTGLKGRVAGVFSVLAFFLTPRNWFHAHLACFDFPICAMWLIVVYGYWRAELSRRWAWGTGVLFGLALATKHNAFFIPPTLVLHWLIVKGLGELRRGGPVGLIRAIPLSFIAMATVGPVVFYLHWPYLWHHPVDRVKFWVDFHLQHVHYAWYYLGDLMREPPFPITYPWVVTAMTVPAAIALAMTTGYGSKLVTLGRWAVGKMTAKEAAALSSDDWLLVLNGVVSFAIIAPPQVPHFGGEKHWMPSMPFLGILAGEVVVRAAKVLATKLPTTWPAHAAPVGLSVLMLAPALWGVASIGGYGTSFYNEGTEGQPGAASLGMQRQFWSNNVTGVLPWLNAHAPQNAKVYFHEVTYDSFASYREDHMLRPDIQFAGGLTDADFACYQYHQEFRFWEYAIWTQLKTQWPVTGLYLDEVPNIECYQRGYGF